MVIQPRADQARTVAARPQRLRAARDVRAVFAARRTAACPYAVVHARRRGDAGPPRVTVVAGKKLGSAVARNRVKRRLRDAVRTVGAQSGRDYVIVGRAATLQAGADALHDALRSVFQKLEERP